MFLSPSDILDMNEINVKLTSEQVAMLNKLLMPYVELYTSINRQFNATINQSNIQRNLDDEIESRR